MNRAIDTSVLNCEKQYEFFSKKNQVALFCYKENEENHYFIKKVHKTGLGANNEYVNLDKMFCLSIPAPKILAFDGNVLYLEYLQGEIFTDILEYNSLPAKTWTLALAKWFWNLHSSTQDKNGNVMLKYDSNLRNFLYKNKTVYGLDFEDSARGCPVEDIGQVCAFILANRPAFSITRLEEASLFVRNYCFFDQSLDLAKVERCIIAELKKMANRKKEQGPIIIEYVNTLVASEKKLDYTNSQYTLFSGP